MKEWLIYAAIMAVVFAVFFRSGGDLVPILAGLLVSLPLYLALGYVLAKFGYQRARLGEGRRARTTADPAGAGSGDEQATRARPAPTRRTSTGRNRPPKGGRR